MHASQITALDSLHNMVWKVYSTLESRHTVSSICHNEPVTERRKRNSKQKLIQLRRNGRCDSTWSQSWGRTAVYGGKGLWSREVLRWEWQWVSLRINTVSRHDRRKMRSVRDPDEVDTVKQRAGSRDFLLFYRPSFPQLPEAGFHPPEKNLWGNWMRSVTGWSDALSRSQLMPSKCSHIINSF